MENRKEEVVRSTYVRTIRHKIIGTDIKSKKEKASVEGFVEILLILLILFYCDICFTLYAINWPNDKATTVHDKRLASWTWQNYRRFVKQTITIERPCFKRLGPNNNF